MQYFLCEDNILPAPGKKKPALALDSHYSCGRVMVKHKEARIVNGKAVKPPHTQPWMVTVSSKKCDSNTPTHSSYGCGGTLISRKHILSATHCAKHCRNSHDPCRDKPVNWATLGDHDKSKKDGEIYIPITKPYKFHPKSRQNKPPNGAFRYDYVIFILERCVTYNDYIQPACLPNVPHSEYSGKLVTVSGWGHTTFKGKGSLILRYIDIEVIKDAKCKDIMKGRASIPYSPQYLMCAGDQKHWDKDACQNDSGGKVQEMPLKHYIERPDYKITFNYFTILI